MTPVQLPEVPAYGIDTANHASVRVRGYTAAQLREYATEAVMAERARLAELAGKWCAKPFGNDRWNEVMETCAIELLDFISIGDQQ